VRHPEKIKHLDIEYNLRHLSQTIEGFGWTHFNKQMKLAVKVRFSNHCYSLEHFGKKEPEGAYFMKDNKGRWRLFCPIRYKHSLYLPKLFLEHCEKPTHTVALTAEDNWSIFRAQIPSPMFEGEKYWVFFRVKPNRMEADGTQLVDIYVESAYPREKPVEVFRRLPFGRLIAETASLIK
jgi:hypothetical protein